MTHDCAGCTDDYIHVRDSFIADRGVTLNGKPACISGRFNAFATVMQFGSALAVQFSWPAVFRVMRDGGKAFKA